MLWVCVPALSSPAGSWILLAAGNGREDRCFEGVYVKAHADGLSGGRKALMHRQRVPDAEYWVL